LGKAEKVDRVELHWLGGAVETYKDLPADRLVTIVEGKGIESIRAFDNAPAVKSNSDRRRGILSDQ
jgi:hypothetical protein